MAGSVARTFKPSASSGTLQFAAAPEGFSA